MNNGKNAKAASVNPRGDDIQRTRQNEFARFGFAAGMSEMGMFGETLHGEKNALSQSERSHRLIKFDILPDFDEVGDGRFGPDYSHDRGGSSRFLPQERSHRDASS
jgi:hypothetical protein